MMARQALMMTGVKRSTTASLRMRAEKKAVVTMTTARKRRWSREAAIILLATRSKKPHNSSETTTSIIPSRSAMVFMSMAARASPGATTPSNIISTAPNSATAGRSSVQRPTRRTEMSA